LIVLLARRDRLKGLEILVLRRELSILRRQAGRARFEPRDRLLAALSRVAAAAQLERLLGAAGDAAGLAPWDGRVPMDLLAPASWTAADRA
jgi:hypothetical protein